jgi:hypothetical protein
MKKNIILVIGLIISVIINIYYGWFFYPVYYPQNVSIPSQEQIHNFCQNKNFDYGWLDSHFCNINEVKCYRKFMQFSEFKCIRWNE